MQRPALRLPHCDLRAGSAAFYAAILLALTLVYAMAFSVTFDMTFRQALVRAASPMAVVASIGLALRVIILNLIFRLAPVAQIAAHPVTALIFSILLYWIRMIVGSMWASGNPVQLRLPDFFAPGASWMLIEGALIYTLIALAAYIEVLRAKLAIVSVGAAQPAETVDGTDQPLRLFVREADEFRPIDPVRIILARGADDYAEIVTAAGTHLVRMTLTALDARLGARFIRVHRSCLVNVERIDKAEPAGGGRMLLHMENGAMITTSRAGARLLREQIV